jgi:hypothetical protein
MRAPSFRTVDPMLVLDLGALRDLIESAVTAVSILGGAMAVESGYAAKKRSMKTWTRQPSLS